MHCLITLPTLAVDLPPGIVFGGIQDSPKHGPLLQCTLDWPESRAHGATFYVAAGRALLLAITDAAEAKCIECGDPTPEP